MMSEGQPGSHGPVDVEAQRQGRESAVGEAWPKVWEVSRAHARPMLTRASKKLDLPSFVALRRQHRSF